MILHGKYPSPDKGRSPNFDLRASEKILLNAQTKFVYKLDKGDFYSFVR